MNPRDPTEVDDDDVSHVACRGRLSAMMDGELTGAGLDRACGHWAEASESRAAWHVYHLIGDVLRSDDLAGGCGREAAFVATLRARLAGEPKPAVAGAPVAAPVRGAVEADPGAPVTARVLSFPSRGRRRAGWALAAGVVAVVGLGSVVRIPNPLDAGTNGALRPLALAGDTGRGRFDADVAKGAGPTAVPVAGGPPSGRTEAEPRLLPPGDPLVRDARLDRYLQAHQQFAGASALGVPSGFLRAATAEPVAR